MTLQLIYGIIADIAFYITCSSPIALLFLLIIGAEANAYMPGFIVMLSASLSCVLRDRGAFRFIPLILLPLALLFSQHLLVMIWIFPMIVYAAVMTVKNSYSGMFSEYANFFKIAAFIVPVLGVLVNIQPMTEGWDTGSFVFSILFLCAGASKLRYMRQSRNVLHNSRAFHINNFIVMMTLVLMSVLLTVGIMFVYEQIDKSEIAYEGTSSNVQYAQPTEIPAPRETEAPPVEGDAAPLSPVDIDETHDTTWLQVILFAVIAFLVLKFVAGRVKRRSENRLHDENTTINPVDAANAVSAKKKTRRRANRESIRRIYKRFLRYLDSRKIKVETYHTSEDINELTRHAAENDAPCDELRELYALARYDREAEITNEHVRLMRELVLKVKRGL